MPVISVIVGAIALLVTVGFGILTARRSAYERVVSTLDFISSGEPAKARHQLGSLIYNYHSAILSGHPILTGANNQTDRSNRIEDLFIVLWSATRVDAVRRSLGPRMLARGPHALLEDSIGKWVKYWVHSEPGTASANNWRIKAVAASLAATLDDDDLKSLTRLREAWSSARV